MSKSAKCKCCWDQEQWNERNTLDFCPVLYVFCVSYSFLLFWERMTLSHLNVTISLEPKLNIYMKNICLVKMCDRTLLGCWKDGDKWGKLLMPKSEVFVSAFLRACIGKFYGFNLTGRSFVTNWKKIKKIASGVWGNARWTHCKLYLLISVICCHKCPFPLYFYIIYIHILFSLIP